MSYANGPLSGAATRAGTYRGDTGPRRPPSDAEGGSGESPARPRGRPFAVTHDVGAGGMLGLGIVIGVAVGAAAALLLAPASGGRTRRRLARDARHARLRAADAWDELGESLRDMRQAWRARERGREHARRGGRRRARRREA